MTGFIFLIASALITFLLLYRRKALVHQLQLSQFLLASEQRLLQSLSQVEERERQRIARDLHDELGPYLATIKLQMYREKNKDSKAYQMLDVAIEQVRYISHNMYPMLLEKLGLSAVLGDLVSYYSNDYRQVFLQLNGIEQISNEKALIMYRVTSELLNNTAKHSLASNVTIRIVVTEVINFEYVDNGIGFDIHTVTGNGVGLESVQVRMGELRATHTFKSSPGHGFRLTFTAPLK